MHVPVSTRTLLQSLMAGAVVLLGAGACSRSDRTESGSDTTAATTQDTTLTGAGQTPSMNVPGGTASDTTMPAGENTGTGAAAGDTAPARRQSNAPRAATAPPSAERQDTSAGYRATNPDTAGVNESDSARVTEDTSETSLNQADTSAVETAGAALPSDTATQDTVAGYAEMARDTSSGADQIDTAAVASAETAGTIQARADTAQAVDTAVTATADTAANAGVGTEVGDTTLNAGRVRPVEDSTEILGQVTTNTTDIAVEAADSAEAAGDAAIAARGADTTGNAGRIRPPEDSTELQGNVSSAESAGVNAADTADEAPVAPESREAEVSDRETQVASETRTETGAAALGGTVTGAEAVAMMTRQGERCNVVDPESDEEVRWDMASTPVTLNPCGLGSMNLSKVWTAGQR